MATLRSNAAMRCFAPIAVVTLALVALGGCRRSSPPDESLAKGKVPAESASVVSSATPQPSTSTSVSAEAPRATRSSPHKPHETPTPAFFHVQSKSAEGYILGSIHVADDDTFPLPSTIENAYAASDELIVEIDMNDDAKAEAGAEVAKAVYPFDDSLEKHVSKKTWKLLDECPGRKLPMFAMKRMHPWVVSIVLMAGAIEKAGLDPENGIDQHFMNAAHASKKKVRSLETVSAQLGIFSGMSAAMQERMLLETLEEIDKLGPELNSLLASWKAGDDAKLDATLREPYKKPEYEGLMKKLVTDRNVSMAAAIDARLDGKGKFFVVVGAAHVIGKGGIVERLREKKRNVTRVTVPAEHVE